MKDLNYLIYGSTALNFWFENTHYSNGLREPQDLDVIIKSDYNNDKSKLYGTANFFMKAGIALICNDIG